MFDYITVAEIDKYTFYRIPKLLITDDKFKSLSCESKLLYGLLIDRASLSKKYNWIDDDGKIYVYFRQEEAQEMLNMASGKAVKIFKELDTFGLIIRIKQGQGKPTKIYVMNFTQSVLTPSSQPPKAEEKETVSQTSDNYSKTQVKTCENRKSENSRSETQVKTCENRKSAPAKIESLPFYIENKTEINKTNLSYLIKERNANQKSEDKIDEIDCDSNTTKSSVETFANKTQTSTVDNHVEKSTSNVENYVENYVEKSSRNVDSHVENFSDEIDEMDMEQVISDVEEQIYAERLRTEHKQALVNEIIEVIASVFVSKQKYRTLSGEKVSLELIRKRLKQLEYEHVDYVLMCLQKNTTKIKNRKNYLLTCLYNAPVSIDGYYENLFNHNYGNS